MGLPWPAAFRPLEIPMHKPALRALLLAVALGGVLPAAAQKVTVESQGQAAVEARAQALSAQAVAKAIGQPPAGQAQVVFFRAATSPGDTIGVEEGDTPLVRLDPGMYAVLTVTPGAHGFDAGGPAVLPVDAGAGQTRYVQAIRDRAGMPQLRRSSATSFQRAAR